MNADEPQNEVEPITCDGTNHYRGSQFVEACPENGTWPYEKKLDFLGETGKF
jgi:hypothetical protein